jgi:hypothetical protein
LTCPSAFPTQQLAGVPARELRQAFISMHLYIIPQLVNVNHTYPVAKNPMISEARSILGALTVSRRDLAEILRQRMDINRATL